MKYTSHFSLPKLPTRLAHDDTRDITVEHSVSDVIRIRTNLCSDDIRDYEYWDQAFRCWCDDEQKNVWSSMDDTGEYELDMTKPS